MFLLGYIAAPPTMGFSANAVPAIVVAMAAAASRVIFFILRLLPCVTDYGLSLACVSRSRSGTTLGTDGFAFSFVITICCERKRSGTFQAARSQERRQLIYIFATAKRNCSEQE